MTLQFPVEAMGGFQNELRELSAGKIQAEVIETKETIVAIKTQVRFVTCLQNWVGKIIIETESIISGERCEMSAQTGLIRKTNGDDLAQFWVIFNDEYERLCHLLSYDRDGEQDHKSGTFTGLAFDNDPAVHKIH